MHVQFLHDDFHLQKEHILLFFERAVYLVHLVMNPDDPVFLIGGNNNFNKGWLGQSLFAREVFEREEGAPPNVNLQLEKLNGNFIKRIIK